MSGAPAARRHLGILFHYPKPEYSEAMRTGFLRVAEIMNQQSGVQALTYADPESGALVAVTSYDDRAAVEAGFRAVAEAGILVDYTSESETRPRERYLLVRVSA